MKINFTRWGYYLILALWIFAAPNGYTVKFQKKAPPNISPPGILYLKIALKYKVKQSKNGKFSSNYKASPIDFDKKISPSRYKPLKRGL